MAVVLVIVAVGLIGFMIVTVVLGVMFMRLPASEPQTANWRQVAKKFRAEISSRGWWRSSPVLRFVYRAARVTVVVKPAHGVEWTRFELRHSCLALSATIGSSEIVNDLEGSPDAVTVPLIADLREERWTGWAKDPPDTGSRVTPVMQTQLVQLHQAVRSCHLQLNCSPGLLLIDVDRPLWSYDALHQLIRCGLSIYDQFRLSSVDGISFVETEELQPLEAVRCRVCGEHIEQELVSCRACKTPHHLECWEYNGQCSTYACGETMYVMPQPETSPRQRSNDAPRGQSS